MSRPIDDIINFDELGLNIGQPVNGIIPIYVGTTGQSIKVRDTTPADTVLKIIEGHVRAVRRAKAGRSSSFNPVGVSGPTSTPIGSTISRALTAGVRSIGLDDPIGNVSNIVESLRSDPRSFIQSLASPQYMPPSFLTPTEGTRIPPAPGQEGYPNPLRPAEPAPLIESIPIIGPIHTAVRTAVESGDTATGLGNLASIIPAAVTAGAGAARGIAAGAAALKQGGTALESGTAGLAAAAAGSPARVAPQRTLPIGGTGIKNITRVPMSLDEITRSNTADIVRSLSDRSRPVAEFNRQRINLLEDAIRIETADISRSSATPIRTLTGEVVDPSIKTGVPSPDPARLGLHEFDRMDPLTIMEIKSSLEPASYQKLVRQYIGKIFEDSMKPGTPNAPPMLNAKVFLEKLDSMPKEKLSAMLGGTRSEAVFRDLRDLAAVMDDLQQKGTLLDKIEALHIAGYRRYGPLFLYLSDATGLIGINWLAGHAVTKPNIMIGLKNFLKAGASTAAEATAAAGVINNVLEQNYPHEVSRSEQPETNIKMAASDEAVMGDIVEAVTGDPTLMQAALDQVDKILYGDLDQLANQLGIRPEDIKIGEMPVGPGNLGNILRKSRALAFRPGSLGEAFSKVRSVIEGHAIPSGGGDPGVTIDILKSRAPEEALNRTGVLGWLSSKVNSRTKIYKSELTQLFKNLRYRAQDASPEEFKKVMIEADTPRKALEKDTIQRAKYNANLYAKKKIAKEVVEEGPGLLDYKVASMEELANVPGRPRWITLSNGARQFLPAMDHKTLIEEKNWKRIMGQAKRDIDVGYVDKTAKQIKDAEERMIRILAQYRKWETEQIMKYKEVGIEPPIRIKGAGAGAGTRGTGTEPVAPQGGQKLLTPATGESTGEDL